MDDLDRRFPWGLTLGVIFSLGLHALLLGLTPLWLSGGGTASASSETQPHEPAQRPKRDQVELGQAASKKSTVAWISHEAFQRMRARRSSTRQPAVQQKARPSEPAPMELDPTPPVAQPRPEQRSQRVTGQPPPLASLAAARPTRGLPHAPTDRGALSFQPERIDQPDEAERKNPRAEADRPRANRRASQSREASPAPRPTSVGAARRSSRQAAAQPRQSPQSPRKPKPTAVPRGDKTAPPSDIRVEPREFQFGKVIAREGITVKTAVPHFSAVARVSSLGPNLPTARVRFAPDGRVIEAKLLQSSGYDNIDDPILASLYKWRATGPKLEARDKPFTITIHFTSGGEK